MLVKIKVAKVNLVDLESEQKNFKMPKITLKKYCTSNFTIFTKMLFEYNLLAAITTTFYLGLIKLTKLIAWRYYWLSLKKDIKVYIKRYNIYLALKTVQHKPYSNLQLLLMPTH